MKKDEFFDDQNRLTTAKIKIFEKYIEGYLPKLLITFKKLIIVDLFCGAGKNGEKDGSPLVLINTINKVLKSNHLSKNDLEVLVLFNDQKRENIKNLKSELEKINYDDSIIKITTKSKKYENYIDTFIEKQQAKKYRNYSKFIFLDPFTYSNVKMDDLNRLMRIKNTEILLFLPIFHSYRFSNVDFDEGHKTKVFMKEFTTKGVHEYNNIIEFMFSIRKKLIKDVKIDFVRPVLLDGGARKNALFLLTKHEKGMLLMNTVMFKNSDDGFRLITDNLNQDTLFKADEFSSYLENFKTIFINRLKKKSFSNKKIVDFTIKEGFLPKQSNKILKELYDKNKLVVLDNNGNKITNKNKWNIAVEIRHITRFEWK